MKCSSAVAKPVQLIVHRCLLVVPSPPHSITYSDDAMNICLDIGRSSLKCQLCKRLHLYSAVHSSASRPTWEQLRTSSVNCRACAALFQAFSCFTDDLVPDSWIELSSIPWCNQWAFEVFIHVPSPLPGSPSSHSFELFKITGVLSALDARRDLSLLSFS